MIKRIIMIIKNNITISHIAITPVHDAILWSVIGTTHYLSCFFDMDVL